MLLGMHYVVGVSEMIFSCHFLVYQDPKALKTGLNDPIDIQTKITDEGSSFIQEVLSVVRTMMLSVVHASMLLVVHATMLSVVLQW